MDTQDQALVHTTFDEAAAAGRTPGVFRQLQERVKELSTLHAATHILQDMTIDEAEALSRIVVLLPHAFMYSVDAAARIVRGNESYESPGFRASPWILHAPFKTEDGRDSGIEVIYFRDHATSADGPFLPEERRLLSSLAAMIGGSLDRRAVHERLALALSTSVRLWDWNIVANRFTWPDIRVGDPPAPLTLTYDGVLDHVHPDDREMMSRAVDAVLIDPSRQDQLVVQVRIAYPGTEHRWRHITARLHRDRSGRPARMLGLSTDITEQRELQDRLRQSEKMDALGRLAGGIAHDFNNILVAVLGFSQLAQEQLESSHPARSHVDEIAKAGESARKLVQQIVAFSRRQELKPRKLDLVAALKDWEIMVRRLLGSRYEFRIEAAPDTPAVLADPGQLFQVVLNLAINARDAMRDGGVITVRTSGEQKSGKTWTVLEVQDTGSGMSPDVQRHIFEPFFTTKKDGKGTGMGLATVHGIVTQSGGSIDVESEAGRGTLFRVRLPSATS